MKPYEYINHIFQKDVYDEDLSDYKPYVINRGMSMHVDMVFYVNLLNIYSDMPVRMQYDYYYYSTRKMKRYTKWQNKSKAGASDLEVIQEYFKYNAIRAKQVLGILTKEQLNTIRENLEKGGTTE